VHPEKPAAYRPAARFFLGIRKALDMTYFYTGYSNRIPNRLKQHGRECIDGIPLTIDTTESLKATLGWWPIDDGVFFPILPNVGDTFKLKMSLCVSSKKMMDAEYKWCRVVARSLHPSDLLGLSAGTAGLLVEVIDGEFSQISPVRQPGEGE
jgi:hypothetical protein